MPDVAGQLQATGNVINQRPITNEPLKNLAMGGAIAGLPNAGFGLALQGMDPLAIAANTGMAAFLNGVIAQPVKQLKFFPEHTLLQPVMFAASFLGLYFVVFNQEVGKAFIVAATSTVTAVANYKADKAAGTNILQPLTPEREFGHHEQATPRSDRVNHSGNPGAVTSTRRIQARRHRFNRNRRPGATV